MKKKNDWNDEDKMKVSNIDEKSTNVKGIKIRTLSWIFALLGILLLGFVSYNLNRVVDYYNKIVVEFDLHLDSHEFVSKLQNGSDDMTENSRLFVVTQDSEYMMQYFSIVDSKIREKAKESIDEYFKKLGYTQSIENLDKALEESNALMEYEIHSMKLIVEVLQLDEDMIPELVKQYQLPAEEENWTNKKKQEQASELVFGDEYRKNKAHIDAGINAAVDSISEKLENHTSDGIRNMWGVIKKMIIFCILLGILFVTVFSLILLLVIRPLQIYVNCVRENRLFDVKGAYEFKYLAQTYNRIYKADQEKKERMSFELEHDTLTNAYSRLAFEEHKKQLAKMELPIALLIIDIDNFKRVNDRYGHDVGDQALKKVAHTLHRLLRNEDIVARIGGDEFAVILRNVYEYSKVVIGEKIDRINDILQKPDDEIPKLSISVGIAFSEHGYNEDLFKQADCALYETKKMGRCGYHIYESQHLYRKNEVEE